MSTFNEADHPRHGDGQWATKELGEVDPGLGSDLAADTDDPTRRQVTEFLTSEGIEPTDENVELATILVERNFRAETQAEAFDDLKGFTSLDRISVDQVVGAMSDGINRQVGHDVRIVPHIDRDGIGWETRVKRPESQIWASSSSYLSYNDESIRRGGVRSALGLARTIQTNHKMFEDACRTEGLIGGKGNIQMEVLGDFHSVAADDYEAQIVEDLGVRTGLLWKCMSCGWANESAAESCEGCSDRRA